MCDAWRDDPDSSDDEDMPRRKFDADDLPVNDEDEDDEEEEDDDFENPVFRNRLDRSSFEDARAAAITIRANRKRNSSHDTQKIKDPYARIKGFSAPYRPPPDRKRVAATKRYNNGHPPLPSWNDSSSSGNHFHDFVEFNGNINQSNQRALPCRPYYSRLAPSRDVMSAIRGNLSTNSMASNGILPPIDSPSVLTTSNGSDNTSEQEEKKTDEWREAMDELEGYESDDTLVGSGNETETEN